MANKRKIKHSFNYVLNIAEDVTCMGLHHKKTHYHQFGEKCKAEYELHKHITIIREYMKENDLQ